MRWLVALSVVVLVGCGDGPSREERVAEVCGEWQAFLDSEHGTQAETLEQAQRVALAALESDTELTLVGGILADSLEPFDRDGFARASEGFAESCG
jgi:hypothetical protein